MSEPHTKAGKLLLDAMRSGVAALFSFEQGDESDDAIPDAIRAVEAEAVTDYLDAMADETPILDNMAVKAKAAIVLTWLDSEEAVTLLAEALAGLVVASHRVEFARNILGKVRQRLQP